MNKRTIGLLVISVAALAVVMLINHQPDSPALEQKISGPVESKMIQQAPPASTDAPELLAKDQQAEALAELSVSLQEKFGALLSNPKIQIRALEKIIQELKQIYGANWQDYIEAFITKTFPEMAELLIARYHNLMAYNEWALEQRFEIAAMSDLERRQYMWDKRMELFGEDAQIIWQGQLRSERVQDALVEIGNYTEMPFEQKIDVYLMQLNDIYQTDASKAIHQHRQEFVDHFLSVGTVQADLRSLPKAERQQQLKKLRQALGMDEEALSRWDKLDDEREQRWRNGKEYQMQRNELQANYQGEELDRQIQKLQQRLFGEEAEIIRSEELSGYFRYEEQQQFGLN